MTDSDKGQSIVWGVVHLFRQRMVIADAALYTLGLLALYRLDQYRKIANANTAISLEGVPDWCDLLNQPWEIGKKIDEAFRGIERKNKWMKDWFSSLDYSHLQGTASSQNDHLLSSAVRLIGELEQDQVSIIAPLSYDELAFSLIEMLQSRGGQGAISTPRSVAHLMMLLLRPNANETFYSPFGFGGGGVILAEAAREMEKMNECAGLYGDGISTYDRTLAALLLVIQHCFRATLELADVIRHPAFSDGKRVRQFDCVAGTIPMTTRPWGDSEAMKDQYGRFIFGIPPPSYGDFAYLSHMIASTKPTGRLAAVVRPAALYRGPPRDTSRNERSEGMIRQNLVKKDVLDAVIQLPSRTYSMTSVPFVLLILTPTKSAERKNKVIFIDASGDDGAGRGRFGLSEASIKSISKAYYDYTPIDGYCTVAPLEKIAEKNWTLSVNEFVIQKVEVCRQFDIDQGLMDLARLHQEKAALLRQLSEQIKRIDGGN